MGTDIHFYVEQRDERGWHLVPCPPEVSVDDYWYEPRGERRCWWCRDGKPDTRLVTTGECDGCGGTGVPYEHWYHDHNYLSFGVLAGVRNSDVETIAVPRGVPSDLSPELREIWATWGEHTPSWLLLSELQAFDWTKKIPEYGKTYAETCSILHDKTLPAMAKLGDPDKVRAVFWFDS